MDINSLAFKGRIVRSGQVKAEGYEFVDSPTELIAQVQNLRPKVDIFTFTERLTEKVPRFAFDSETEPLAVMPITTYDHWWKVQLNDKTRNMVRKAAKKGVEIRQVAFDDQLVAGIERIHNEHPLRQGRPFKHYGKPFEQVKKDHASFLDRSEFFGAFLNGELIGFIKLVHQGAWSNLMQIISMIGHRDKAPTNALIAKAVERCAEKGIGQLQYGMWSRKGIGDFKLHHGFERIETIRYYVPLTLPGRLLMRSDLHHNARRLIPEGLMDFAMDMRTKWLYRKFSDFQPQGAVAQLVEHKAKA